MVSFLVSFLLAWFGSFTNLDTTDFELIEDYRIEYETQHKQSNDIMEADVEGL